MKKSFFFCQHICYKAGLGSRSRSRSRSELGVFGSLEPELELLEKKYQKLEPELEYFAKLNPYQELEPFFGPLEPEPLKKNTRSHLKKKSGAGAQVTVWLHTDEFILVWFSCWK